ncbi:MAG: alpha/beta hydrolase [Vicinamibacterales bacterium]|jgi:pimeloyl-ACP methyl ester carboxylesterase|nr:alpha/beta hydrolase [Vicinamibacterales bacterium]MDP7479197.1 alpha/beta hydrolase [Vicinamibacterales bacterium]MDP7691052.1 alpha/beta hydrolase [Vicinamibacterales bacterium]HJN46956.1 alpha/beta hydrolase [Vicinamibacterales bacterium]|tara:strand:+ start:2757 stop:3686 length:930 start_codon:yes stop_codon:yes gene_type:complete
MRHAVTVVVGLLLVGVALVGPVAAQPGGDLFDRVEHGFADSDGVRIHYATLGSGPLMVLIHGFPDFWYLWRHQMETLSADYEVVAIDQRGYNLSDKPRGVDQYDIALLAADVAAVVSHLGRDRATIVGHDWGGFVAWQVAMAYPELTDNLIIFNLPHPRGLRRELATNQQQKLNSAYARRFQQEDAHLAMSAEQLAQRHSADPLLYARYLDAYRRSDFEAMLNYYKANYPAPPYLEDTTPVVKVRPPVLQFHGLDDTALLDDMLNGSWEWLEQDLTLVTIPDAGHWAVTERAPFVTDMMRSWLALQASR